MKNTPVKAGIQILAALVSLTIFLTACDRAADFGAFVDEQLKKDTSNQARRNSAEITAFYFVNPLTNAVFGTGAIDSLAEPPVISVTVPAVTGLSSLTPTVRINGASYSPAGARDFGASAVNPVEYTVYSINGKRQKTYHVTVKSPGLSAIVVHTPPVKTVFQTGDVFDPSGLRIDGIFGSVAAPLLPSGWNLVYPAGFDPNSLNTGEHIITVRSTEDTTKTTTFTISVQASPLAGIAITTLPQKLVYLKDENFDPAGLAARGVLGNGTMITIPPGSISIANASSLTASAGVTDLVISVNGIQSSGVPGAGAVKVLELDTIAITAPPANTFYRLNAAETLKKNGLVIEAAFTNNAGLGETREILHADGSASFYGGTLSDDFPTSNPAFTTAGDTVINFTYTHGGISKDAPQTIRVVNSSGSSNSIVFFRFPSLNANGTINETDGEIDVEVPYPVSLTALTPDITITGTSISPSSGVSRDFNAGPAEYTVSAQDGSQKTYAVNVHYPAKTGASSEGSVCTVLDGSITYEVHIFKKTGHLSFPTDPGISNADVLVVGGGGGGGFGNDGTHPGGGGGAGGFVSTSGVSISGASDFAVTVGSGGQGAQTISGWLPGDSGGSSSFGSLIAYGGGGGASYENLNPRDGASGASGGGGAGLSRSGGGGLSGQGKAGGASVRYSAGGGGGAGANGAEGTIIVGSTTGAGGNGGTGRSSAASGSARWYSGGGSSGISGAQGGTGGGGGACSPGFAGGFGAPGSGGGGAGGLGTGIRGGSGGDGGSGIVIIRFPYVP
jgi:hypothetical protein